MVDSIVRLNESVRGTVNEGRFDDLTPEGWAKLVALSNTKVPPGAFKTTLLWDISYKADGRSTTLANSSLTFTSPDIIGPEMYEDMQYTSAAQIRPNPHWLSALRSHLETEPEKTDWTTWVVSDLIASEGGKRAAVILSRQTGAPSASLFAFSRCCTR